MNASELIERRIKELGDWRGERMKRLRTLISETAPQLTDEWKWDTPVWTFNGNVLAVGAFQDHLKINFFHGALLEDHHLFNAGLESKTTRAIDIFEKDNLDETALRNLIRSAVELNTLKSNITKPSNPASSKKNEHPHKKTLSDLPRLAAPAQRALSGAGIQNLRQLSKWSEKEIKDLHGIGPNALQELKRALKEKRLSFAKEEREG